MPRFDGSRIVWESCRTSFVDLRQPRSKLVSSLAVLETPIYAEGCTGLQCFAAAETLKILEPSYCIEQGAEFIITEMGSLTIDAR